MPGARAGGASERGGVRSEGPGLLCVANFPSNTGYAWEFIEGLYAGVADGLAGRGVRTWVAYPRVEAAPRTLAGSAARAVELDVRLDRPGPLAGVLAFVRRHGIRAMYLTDRAAWDPAYALLRLAGVRHIVVHDHTSGARTVPRGVKRLVKGLSRRLPGATADVVLGVSEYVARRKVEVDLVPPERVKRVWNAVPIPALDGSAGERIRREFGIEPERPVVVCASRATPEKGVQHLVRAFDRVCEADAGAVRPVLVYMGAGPALEALRGLRESLAHRESMVFAGYREDAAELLAGADLCVAPSVWEEAFGLSVLEPMARAVAVVASRVGGIPEVLEDGVSGLLVPPGDEAALAGAIRALLADPARRRRMGLEGRRRAEAHFTLERELGELVELVGRGLVPAAGAGGGAEREAEEPGRMAALDARSE